MIKKILSIILIVAVCAVGTFIISAQCTKYKVTASGLNVRLEPNTNCNILGVVLKGDVVEGGQSNNGWTPITWNGNTAYVCSAYIVATNEPTKQYTDEDLSLLARVINAEAGSDWLTDEHQLAVGSVVLNRVSDSRFPSTLKGVVYQKGQYACVPNGMINRAPSERALKNAKYLLENGSTIPTNVVWQSQAKQGNGVWKYIQGHYFCY